MKKLLLFTLLVIVYLHKSLAAPAYPGVLKYTQPDGSEISILLKGDETVHWAETTDGYTLLSNGKNGWEYAYTDSKGDLKASGVLARELNKRTSNELKLLRGLSKNIRFSQKQVNVLKSVWEAKYGSEKLIGAGQFFKKGGIYPTTPDGRRKVFSPTGTKKLILILIEYTDVKFTKTRQDFVDLMNTQNYNLNGAEGSVKDYFNEISYGQFNLQTDVAPQVYTADYDMAYYGAPNGSSHDIRAYDLMLEAVQKADADVDFSQYDNDADGSVDGVYIIYAGFGEASSGLVNTIWPHASSISGQSFDGKSITKYSCSNELNANGTLTSIGVICHEFGHVCGAPDYYDTNYATGGDFIATGNWDLMDRGLYNTTTAKSGSKPAHLNPMEKIRAGWVTPTVINGATSLTIPDISSNPAVYIYNTTTANEYFMLENRQKTGFNGGCPGHGLMIYHYSKTVWDATRNKTYPQGFYPVFAGATTNPGTTAASYGNINTSACPFPGTMGKRAFYDTGIPNSKSWAGNDTGFPITAITENANGTVSLNVSTINTCNSAPATQASAFSVNSQTYKSMNISWVRGSGDKVLVVAREGNEVDMNPLNGTNYTANAIFKTGDEIGSGNYVVYNGTGNAATITGLSGSLTYYYAVYEYNSAENCYLTPALSGSGTTNCGFYPASYIEDFEKNSFGCWSAVDNTGQGNWKIGTFSNRTYTPALSGSYAYFSSELGIAHSYNADLISPTFDLSTYTNMELRFKHLFDAYSTFPSTGTVSYSIDNGASWTQLASYTSDTPNPQSVALAVNAAIGQPQVKFKWNYTCSPTGANFWAVDDVQVVDTELLTIQSGDIITLNTPMVLNNVTIQSGAALVVSAGNQLTVNGSFVNNAGNSGLILQSNASGTATFLDNVTTPNSVNATVQQHLSTQRNWYMSVPVSSFAVPSAQDYSLYYYPENNVNQSTYNGGYWLNPIGYLSPVVGYIVKPSTDKTGLPIEFTGTLNSGSITSLALTNSATTNPSKHGYNLIGNPYPSYLNAMTAINNNPALEKTIWYKTLSSGPNPIYQIETVQTITGLGTNNTSAGTVTGYIPPMQAFWIKANAETTLTFDNSMRTHANPLVEGETVTTTPLKVIKTSNKEYPVLLLQVSNNTNSDETILYFNEHASDSFDAYDSPKMSNGNNAIPEIYTFAGNQKVAINGLNNSVSTTNSIALGINTGAANTFNIAATQVSGFDANTRIVLRDNALDIEQDITDGIPYTFTTSAGSTVSRFSILFKTASITTALLETINSTKNADTKIALNVQNQLVITLYGNKQPEQLSIYNTVGQCVFNTTIANETNLLNCNLSAGIYVVKVKNVTKKIYIPSKNYRKL